MSRRLEPWLDAWLNGKLGPSSLIYYLFSNFDIDDVYIDNSQYFEGQRSLQVSVNESLYGQAPNFKWETMFKCVLVIPSR